MLRKWGWTRDNVFELSLSGIIVYDLNGTFLGIEAFSPEDLHNFHLMAASRTVSVFIFFVFFIDIELQCSDAGSWIKAGYWYVDNESSSPDINSALFTHLICAFAGVNSSSYRLSIPSYSEQYFASFNTIVRRKNPSVATLLSIWGGQEATYKSILGEKLNSSVLSSMVSESSFRKSFIESSIRTARLYGFDGLDLFWLYPSTDSDMKNLGFLLREWREAIGSEPRNESESKLILSMAVRYLPTFGFVTYPIDSMRRSLDFAHIMAYDYHLPVKENFTGVHAALFDPSSNVSTDFGIRQWIGKGFPVSSLVLGLPYHGYAWTLAIPGNKAIGSPGRLGLTQDGSVSYKYIKWYIRNQGANIEYNASYVVNYCTVGLDWIGYDDVEAVRAKVSYAKERKLLGYNVFLVTNDDNWDLSRAAAQVEGNDGKNRRLLLIVLLPIVFLIIIIILSSLACYLRVYKSRGRCSGDSLSAGNQNGDGPLVRFFSFAEIEAATDNFSSENKLGEGGYGPVYKGVLGGGRVLAVKRLSKTSTQGLEEFENEVMLTARLQHVNLLRVIGFCTEGEEKMLVYEYMPNRSLDFYLFDPVSQYSLDWGRRVIIIEGITHGLLYLQEYSNFTIIHRDLKASNILLDNEMNPKISDFGIARLFAKDELEASTGNIIGTYGYAPPEYVRKGIYSMKYDVYSFGVLLLQIISGKRNTCCYGPYKSLSLLEHAYDLWKDGRGMEFINHLLDDTSSPCKLMTCLQMALLCVQESPEDRPTMLEVYSTLFKNGGTGSISTPKTPAFSVKSVAGDAENTEQDVWSVNVATMSQLIPR